MPPSDGSRTVVVVVVAAGPTAARGGRDGARADLGVVDALARLELAARRVGWSVRLHATCDHLAALLDLAGLGAVVGSSGLARRSAHQGA